MMVSLDGYFEGPDHDLSWHHVDDEFNRFAVEQLHEADTIMFGRRTYQLMEGFWPNYQPEDKDNEMVRDALDNFQKIVFSKTLEEIHETENWKNVKLRKGVDPDEVKKLKQQNGKDIIILASSNLCVSLIEHKLIDEFRIMVNPVAIGKGTPLFKGLKEKLELKLEKTRTFKNGNILLYHVPQH